MDSLQAQVQLVRELLEGAMAPEVATATLFEALQKWGRGVPSSSEEVLELVRGPLADVLEERLGSSQRDEIVTWILARLAARGVTPSEEIEVDIEMDLDLDLDLETAPETTDGAFSETLTAQMPSVAMPVVVLVVAGHRSFGDLLLAAIGPDRVYPVWVQDEAQLRHATFSRDPLIVLVNGTEPPSIGCTSLARALAGLPDSVLPVVWATETSYGNELCREITSREVNAVLLERREGIDPISDLILSRFKRTSSLPPPPGT